MKKRRLTPSFFICVNTTKQVRIPYQKENSKPNLAVEFEVFGRSSVIVIKRKPA